MRRLAESVHFVLSEPRRQTEVARAIAHAIHRKTRELRHPPHARDSHIVRHRAHRDAPRNQYRSARRSRSPRRRRISHDAFAQRFSHLHPRPRRLSQASRWRDGIGHNATLRNFYVRERLTAVAAHHIKVPSKTYL